MTQPDSPWWDHRRAILVLSLLAAVPLLWPEVPPLVDLPGHMGRYRVQLELDSSAALRAWYDFEWALIGNLGIDLLVVPLARIFGLELAVKLIVLTIPPLTVAGLLLVAREVHGRLPPTALFAVPFAYNFPFVFGFANFALSMALALFAFWLWLRLGHTGRPWLRAILFVPISALIWVTHTFGWGTLGAMAFSAEAVRQHDLGRGWLRGAFRAGVHCLALTPPILLMLAWRNGAVAGFTGDWFNWERKLDWLKMALRDRWEWFDLASLAIALGVLALALFSRRLTYSRNLAASALFLMLVYALLPRIVFGSAYADMRLAPYMIAVAIVAIRPRPATSLRFLRAIAAAGLVFLLVRLGGNTLSFYLYDRAYDRELAALEHVPEGARLVSFVGHRCRVTWAMSRLEHLPAMALVRRRAFSNDQWALAGAQLLRVDYPAAQGFERDPSQLVTLWPCGGEFWRPVHTALATFPREAFDYVWLIQPPPHDPRLAAGLQPVWRSGRSVLYRVTDRRPPVVKEF